MNSRMTGAKIVSSTDHMFQQFGQECLGTCGKFSLRIIKNDPEKIDLQQTKRILKTRIAPGTTYAYLEGCPSGLMLRVLYDLRLSMLM